MIPRDSSAYWTPALPLIAILCGIRPGEALAHVEVLIDAGFDAIEILLNSPEWQSSLRLVLERFGKDAWIGGGTVLTIAEVDMLKVLRARLMVAPNVRPALISYAIARNLTVVPGVATPTDAFEALDAGAQALKIFPASIYGPDFIRAVRAVLPPVSLYAVGGVTPENLGSFVAAGCVGAGLGSQLYKPAQPVSRTESMAKAFLQAFREATR
jgi:2-dehydro-3-deoxyphosphogalactonate aldolase